MPLQLEQTGVNRRKLLTPRTTQPARKRHDRDARPRPCVERILRLLEPRGRPKLGDLPTQFCAHSLEKAWLLEHLLRCLVPSVKTGDDDGEIR